MPASAAGFGEGACHQPREDTMPTQPPLSLSWQPLLAGQPAGHPAPAAVGRASLATFPHRGSIVVTAPEGGRVHQAPQWWGGCHSGWLETGQMAEGAKATLSPHRHMLAPTPSPHYLELSHGGEVVPGPGSGRWHARWTHREAAGRADAAGGTHPA